MSVKLFLVVFILSGLPVHTWAARLVILTSDQNNVYVQVKQGLLESVKGDITEINLQDSAERSLDEIMGAKPDLVVAIGNPAALWCDKVKLRTGVVMTGIVRQSLPHGSLPFTGVSIDFPLANYLDVIKSHFPKATRVGALASMAQNDSFSRELHQAAEGRGIEINCQPVANEKKVAPAMQVLKDWKADVFLMTYDPVIMNRETWQFLVGFSITNRMALMVPSRALLKNGGTISLEANYVAVGRQTAALVNRILEDSSLLSQKSMASPSAFEIFINMKMADLVGAPIPAETLKKDKLVN